MPVYPGAPQSLAVPRAALSVPAHTALQARPQVDDIGGVCIAIAWHCGLRVWWSPFGNTVLLKRVVPEPDLAFGRLNRLRC
jgi:hypothetical protein